MAPAYRPVIANRPDESMVPWESWVYVYNGAGGGMEVTFTDERLTGKFDFAPAPVDVDVDIRKLAMFNRFSPKNVSMRCGRSDAELLPASRDGKIHWSSTTILPTSEGRAKRRPHWKSTSEFHRRRAQYVEAEGVTTLEVERTIAVLNMETGQVYRAKDDVRFRRQGNMGQQAGAFVPDAVRLDVPQGSYRMEVKARDRRTGRRGRYRQTIHVEAYPETGLRISDLELAWRISKTSLEDKFSKGELHVVPMPTRTYGKGHNVYVYYEIYNLARDTFGQTRFRVAYTVGEKGEPGIGNIARLVRLRGNRRAEVEVAYELVGTQRSEVEYVALQTGATKCEDDRCCRWRSRI